LAGSRNIARRLICSSGKVLSRALRLVAGGALVGAIALHSAAGADRRNTAADPTKPMPFDLPAQPLASALESYSVSSGWQVIYNGRLTAGRQSSAVKGDFTPGAALRMLLAGTSLIPQYRAVDGAILVPDPMATLGPDEIADNVAPSLKGYYGLIQTKLERAFCASPPIRVGAYRVALGFWIGSSGTVTRMVLLSSSGRADIDDSFDRAVRSLAIGMAPPAGFAQPVVLLVTPELVGKCGAVDTRMRPIRTAQ
jgi:hypothetical protein